MTELIGHRGYPARYPENTILGFKKAVEIGCDGIELDVRLTKDNKVVVIHDKDLKRTTNGEGLVGEYTLKGLKKLDAGRGEKIPALEEVLTEIVDVKLLIELKEYSERICTEVVKLAGKRKNTFFISFSIEAIQYVKKINPKLNTGLIFSKPLIEPEKYIRFINALCPRVDRLDSRITIFAMEYKLDTYVWTVDTTIDLGKVLQYGVTGVVTNDPGEIGKKLYHKATKARRILYLFFVFSCLLRVFVVKEQQCSLRFYKLCETLCLSSAFVAMKFSCTYEKKVKVS